MPDQVQLVAHDINTGAFLTNLPHARNIAAHDVLADIGRGGFTIHQTAPELAAADLTSTVVAIRVQVNGTDRFAWRTRSFTVDEAVGERDVRTITFDGPGLIEWLSRGLIYPEGGLAGVSPDERLFAFQSADYVEGPDWNPANTDIGRQNNPTGVAGFDRYAGFPEGFPDPQAFWIAPEAAGPSGNGGIAHPEGVWRARVEVTIPETGEYVMALAGDNVWRVWWDGELVTRGNYYRNEEQRQLGVVEAGTHVWAAEIVNSRIGGGIDNPSSLLGSILLLDETTESGFGAVVARTNGSWSVLPVGSAPPGMTPGEILRICLTEAQARGAIPGFQLGAFTDSVDSAGVAWTPIELALQVGNDTVLSLVKRLNDYDVYVRCGPDGTLEAYEGIPSQDRPELVMPSGSGGQMLRDLEVFDTILVRTEAGWTEHPASPPAVRHEAYNELGLAPSAEVGATVGEQFAAEYTSPADVREIRVPVVSDGLDAPTPWVDVLVGDTPRHVNPLDGALETVRLMSVGMDVDDESGLPEWRFEVQT